MRSWTEPEVVAELIARHTWKARGEASKETGGSEGKQDIRLIRFWFFSPPLPSSLWLDVEKVQSLGMKEMLGSTNGTSIWSHHGREH